MQFESIEARWSSMSDLEVSKGMNGAIQSLMDVVCIDSRVDWEVINSELQKKPPLGFSKILKKVSF